MPATDLPAAVRAALATDGAPGSALVLVTPASQQCLPFGERALGSGSPIDADTLFGIGSLSKAFAATTLARLADQDRLSLDDPVRRWLPNFGPIAGIPPDAITVRDLLAGRTGLSLWDEIPLRLVTDQMAAMARMAARLPPRAPFRQQFTYSNAMLTTAGLVLEAVAGRPWDIAVAQTLLAPLGMHRTTADRAAIAKDQNRAEHHLPAANGMQPRPWSVYGREAGGPSGALYASADDMARWLRFHLGTLPLADGWHPAACHQPQIGPGPEEAPDWPAIATRHGVATCAIGYGLGWHLHDYRGLRLVHHSGGSGGYISWAGLVPARGIAAAVLLNGRSGRALNHALGLLAIDHLLGESPAIDWPAALAALPRPASILSVDAPAPTATPAPQGLEGRYRNSILNDPLTIAQTGTQLTASTGALYATLDPLDADTLLLTVRDRLEHPFTERLTIHRNPNGRITTLNASRTAMLQNLHRVEGA